jgi:8-oxo-dGTP pyrophosphatase MutT (NUDIX family)
MASFLDKFKSLINKNAQQTAIEYNKAIYNWLGDSIVWNSENDNSYITEGYRKNATIYSLINLITKAATTIPFQVYEKKNENDTATNVRARAELFASILREVVEETGVPFSSLSPPKLIGAMLDYFGKPDLLFRVKTNLTSREVLEKCETARDAWESDSAEIVEAPGRREKNHTNEVHLAHNQELSRKFWRRCPVSMAATTRAMAECLSSL